MSIYTINITLTDAEETAMQSIVIKSGKPLAQIFQEFWDGYAGAKGPVRVQILQWISDEIKSEIAKLSDADALAKLKV